MAGKLTELKRQVEDIRRRRQSQEDKVAALENPMLKVIIEDYYFILSHVCGLLVIFCSHRETLHFSFLNIDWNIKLHLKYVSEAIKKDSIYEWINSTNTVIILPEVTSWNPSIAV